LNFGDEYFFYGNIETEIQATIYEMRWLCNLSANEFTYTSNPTWSAGTASYITEVGLLDENRNLMAISKLQSPVLRQSIQQFLIKFDF
jgi:beta-N-acetylglucosaminidase